MRCMRCRMEVQDRPPIEATTAEFAVESQASKEPSKEEKSSSSAKTAESWTRPVLKLLQFQIVYRSRLVTVVAT